MKICQVSLKVKDLSSMLSFYEKELGLTILRTNNGVAELGPSRLEAPILILRSDPSAEKPPDDAAGLYHYALRVPDRRSLARAYLSIGSAGVVFDGYADHLVSEALYLKDPEGNGIEIYADRPRSQWKFDEDGQVNMATQPLDLDSLMKETAGEPNSNSRGLAEGTIVGHIHLKVTDLQRSITFYRNVLGLDVMRYYGSAAFLSVGRYHHHIGMNTWESLGGQTMKKNWTGLEHFTINITRENLDELRSSTADVPSAMGNSEVFLSDPDGIELVFRAS
jgi:catechol 2,3-dioxygenase